MVSLLIPLQAVSIWRSTSTYGGNLHFPDSVGAKRTFEQYRGVLITFYGSPVSGTNIQNSHSPEWVDFFHAQGFIVMQAGVGDINSFSTDWAEWRAAFTENIQPILDAAAAGEGHPEISDLPFITSGCSENGVKSHNLVQGMPERAICSIPLHAGVLGWFYTSDEKTPEMLEWQIPMLHIIAGFDKEWVFDMEDLTRMDAKSVRRATDGPWTIALDPGVTHCEPAYDAAETRRFDLLWIEEILRLRLKPGEPLQPIDMAQGWYADYDILAEGTQNPLTDVRVPWNGGVRMKNPVITAHADLTAEERATRIWLPGEEIAERWLEYAIDGMVGLGPVEISTSSLPSALLGVNYQHELQTSGGYTPFTWSLDGALPSGMQFSAGVFWGIPTATGVFHFEVEVVDGAGTSGRKAFSLIVENEPDTRPTITSGAPAEARIGFFYTHDLTSTGGNGDAVWEIGGSLPEGLELVENRIQGTPVSSGVFDFSVVLKDSDSHTGPGDEDVAHYSLYLEPYPIGWVDTFEDGVVSSLFVPESLDDYTLTESGGVLQIDVRKSTNFRALLIKPTEENFYINMYPRPYVQVRLKASRDVLFQVGARPEGIVGNPCRIPQGNWPSELSNVPGDNQWRTYFFDFESTFAENNTTGAAVHTFYLNFTPGTTWSGTVWIDEIRVGGAVVPVAPTMTFDPFEWKWVMGAIPGMNFRLVCSETLLPLSWQTVGTPVKGTAEEVVFFLDPPDEEGSAFYRVLMEP